MKLKFKIITFAAVLGITFMSFMQIYDLKKSINRGKSIYQTNCMSCHMTDGAGLQGVFPPLNISERLEDTDRLVSILQNGLNGKVEIGGVTYNGQMSAMNLSDQEAADVLNYVRNSWGSDLGAITPAEVKALKN